MSSAPADKVVVVNYSSPASRKEIRCLVISLKCVKIYDSVKQTRRPPLQCEQYCQPIRFVSRGGNILIEAYSCSHKPSKPLKLLQRRVGKTFFDFCVIKSLLIPLFPSPSFLVFHAPGRQANIWNDAMLRRELFFPSERKSTTICFHVIFLPN